MVSKDARRGAQFRYDGVTVDPRLGEVRCLYSLDERQFVETIKISAPQDAWSRPGVDGAVRLLFLVAAISYYKTGAPPVIDTGELALTDAERELLHALVVDGLGEFSLELGVGKRAGISRSSAAQRAS